MGLCGVVKQFVGWSSQLAFVEVYVVLYWSSEFGCKLLLLVEPYQLSKLLFEQYEKLHPSFGPQDDLHSK